MNGASPLLWYKPQQTTRVRHTTKHSGHLFLHCTYQTGVTPGNELTNLGPVAVCFNPLRNIVTLGTITILVVVLVTEDVKTEHLQFQRLARLAKTDNTTKEGSTTK